jgi:hypothetical protein
MKRVGVHAYYYILELQQHSTEPGLNKGNWINSQDTHCSCNYERPFEVVESRYHLLDGTTTSTQS